MSKSLKDRMIELNQDINWVGCGNEKNHKGNGRNIAFEKWIEGARDWAVSRNRYWGCPIPIWKSDYTMTFNMFGDKDDTKTLDDKMDSLIWHLRSPYGAGSVQLTDGAIINNENELWEMFCEAINKKTNVSIKKIMIFGSIEAIEFYSRQKINDLHRPFIDNVKIYLPRWDAPDDHSPEFASKQSIVLQELQKEHNFDWNQFQYLQLFNYKAYYDLYAPHIETFTRVTEVLDCWFESGSMPFASIGFPFKDGSIRQN